MYDGRVSYSMGKGEEEEEAGNSVSAQTGGGSHPTPHIFIHSFSNYLFQFLHFKTWSILLNTAATAATRRRRYSFTYLGTNYIRKSKEKKKTKQ